MNGRHAKLHAALFASGQWLWQDASIQGQSLHHLAVTAQRVGVVDLLFENARGCKGNAAHTPAKEQGVCVVGDKVAGWASRPRYRLASLF